MDIIKIDENFIEFNNQKFRKDKRTGYYWTVDIPRKSLHLSVYEFYGNIRSEGYEIHHIDFNKENNDISNLACISSKEHHNIHEEKRKLLYGKNWNLKNIKKAQKALSKWHSSDDYKIWLKKTYKERQKNGQKSHAKREISIVICDICGKTFTGYKKRKRNLCSNKCRAKDRRESGLDDIEKNCIVCGKIFISNKFQNIQTCSNSCRATFGYSNRDKN